MSYSEQEYKKIRNEIQTACWMKVNDFESCDYTFASSVPSLLKIIESKGTKTSEIIFDNCRFVYWKKAKQVYRYQ